ncbi:mannose-1-phosphate guanylyltransferase/mannose-6-phosphate isomerase [Paenibacillus silvae]|uniref:mannose-1-phosphate guanylyltransferase n=1 Tax=Paenibacillus silvae TaxID=1325358 RepID=A0ABQ1ZFQ6_9BACL|nr:mannose-1-phosphate guanylyltransferase/mannose-6-phosphate isomerase [Paenibacillus silvae]GGH64050.1 mannose-1-phosphate guanylyltransferase/mannose-6-phosphate isomerase [Paenibacillus silvae]
MINVVLCGGNGTRLWPLSRTLYPKQFNKMMGDRSLFQMTVERNNSLCDQTYIVSNEEQYFLALDHLNELEMKADKFILEPVGRNTAPAIALACFAAGEDDLVLVTPSDHVVQNQEAYNRCLETAKNLALKGHMVTFGINPNYPETGYGYIEADGQDVVSFKEKPDHLTAERYLRSGNYYWNSGMFLFKAGVFLKELRLSDEEIFQKSRLAFNDANTHYDTIRIPKEKMESIPSNSVDYAVMEHSSNVKVVSSDIGWSDLGSFEALYEQLLQDEAGNSLSDHYIQVNSSRNLVISNDRLIATIDVEDLIIVDTPDALMISRQGSSQKVKEVVNELKLRKSNLCDNHVTAYRPWGNHTELDVSSNYKIKKVVVKPGERLSMQKHFHRNEHWIVVSGTALITVNGEQSLLRRNESSFIQMGDEHTVENPGKIDLHLIEVQVGEYVGEDDVVRR